jgi:hypothetical protein
MVMVATVLGCCLCPHHLVVIVACHHPLLAIALFAPSPSLLPALSLPSSTPTTLVALPMHSSLPLLLLACHSCHCCHRLAALTLFVAHHPHCCCNSPHCCPPQALPPALPSLLLARHPHCRRHCSCHRHHPHCHRSPLLLPLQLPSFLPLPSLARHPCCRCAASGGGGEDHTNLVRDPSLAATAGGAIIVVAFATRATSRKGPVINAWAFNAWQTACTNKVGLLSAFM